jgi:uncharacterized surface protein with fasciclin (FAS1) repeats
MVSMTMKARPASCDGPRVGNWSWQCARSGNRDETATVQKKSLLETAAAAGQFTVLTKVIEAAGLTELLASKGPFTVFAPTDVAFGSVPQETLMDLLKAENQARLRSVLRNHIVPGAYRAGEVTSMRSVPTLEGLALEFRLESGVASIGNAKIEQTDIEASNGVIHVIDSVLLP